MPNYVIQIGNSILGSGAGIFVVGEPVAATPTYSVAAGTYNNNQTVSIASATMPSNLYYTTDGSPPTYPISGTTQLYTGALLLDTATTLRALAVATGYVNSPVGSATYAFQVAVPVIAPSTGTYNTAQTCSIAVGTSGAAIYYTTNGTTPTAASTPYSVTGPFTILANTTVSAIGILAGYTNSLVSTATYVISIPQVATPTFSPLGNTYDSPQDVMILCTTPGATIWYTNDGSTPMYPVGSSTTIQYTGPIAITTGETVTLRAIGVASGYTNSNVSLTETYTVTSGGATVVFNYPNFPSQPSTISTYGGHVVWTDNSLQMCDGVGHHGGNAFYTTQQTPGPFTTEFQFQYFGLSGGGLQEGGFSFVIQDVQSPPFAQNGIFHQSPLAWGSDANGCGLVGAMNQLQGGPNAVGIKFDTGNSNDSATFYTYYPTSGNPSSTGLYFNQAFACAPTSLIGMLPSNDLNPFGVNFYTGHTYNVKMVYDGSLLTMTITDSTSGAGARFEWPLNLANTTNAKSNYVGFAWGCSEPGPYVQIHSWSYYTGYSTRLATPTFSVSPGNYTSAQSVTLGYPAGSTCYYTTDGLAPTTASTQYTGPLTVSANQVLQAVAVQSGFTDSFVAKGNYVIGTSSNEINFPTGFTAGSLIPAGYAYQSGSTYRFTDSQYSTTGAVWFPVPVTIAPSFSTAFTLDIEGGAQGMCFVIQNNPQPYVALGNVQIVGTSGEITFSPTTLSVGQYITVAGTFGGTGSISGYSNTTTYLVGATNGTTTATLCGAGVHTPSQSGITWNTEPQSLVAGASVTTVLNGMANQCYYILASGLTSTTCEISASPGGSPFTPSQADQYIIMTTGTGGGGALLTTTTGTPSGVTWSINAPNYSGGSTTVGQGGPELGYGGLSGNKDTHTAAYGGRSLGILNSLAIAFTQFAQGGDPGNSIGLYTRGEDPWGAGIASGLGFNTTYNVTLTYSGTSLAMTMQATSGGTIFSHTWTGIDLASIIGTDTAYVGFTGGSGGGAHAIQAVTAWTL
jgi:hypothetical protein